MAQASGQAPSPGTSAGPAARPGRWRLRIFLAGLGGGSCAVAMALFMIFYGPPFEPVWWAVMAAILAAVAVLFGLCAPLIEWVAKGYLDSGGNS